MPAGSINTMVASMENFSSTEEYLQYVAGYMANNFGELAWLLNNLDSVNVKYLIAERIKTGTLNAGKVTIKSELEGGATITLDKDGFAINYPSGMSIVMNETGFKITYASGVSVTFDELGFTITKKLDDGTFTDVLYIDTFGNASYTGDIDVGANIHVDSDVYVGNKLYIDPTLYEAGIRWATTGGDIDIYIDPASKALFLSSPYAVFLNGMNVVSEINSLKSRVSSLEARPVYVPPTTT